MHVSETEELDVVEGSLNYLPQNKILPGFYNIYMYMATCATPNFS